MNHANRSLRNASINRANSLSRFVAVIPALLTLITSARAGIQFFADRAAWQKVAGAPSFTEDFSKFTKITPFQTAPLALNGMTIQQEGTERFEWNEVDLFPSQFDPNSGSTAALLLVNYPEKTSGIQVRITFNNPNKTFGFDCWSA